MTKAARLKSRFITTHLAGISSLHLKNALLTDKSYFSKPSEIKTIENPEGVTLL